MTSTTPELPPELTELVLAQTLGPTAIAKVVRSLPRAFRSRFLDKITVVGFDDPESDEPEYIDPQLVDDLPHVVRVLPYIELGNFDTYPRALERLQDARFALAGIPQVERTDSSFIYHAEEFLRHYREINEELVSTLRLISSQDNRLMMYFTPTSIYFSNQILEASEESLTDLVNFLNYWIMGSWTDKPEFQISTRIVTSGYLQAFVDAYQLFTRIVYVRNLAEGPIIPQYLRDSLLECFGCYFIEEIVLALPSADISEEEDDLFLSQFRRVLSGVMSEHFYQIETSRLLGSTKKYRNLALPFSPSDAKKLIRQYDSIKTLGLTTALDQETDEFLDEMEEILADYEELNLVVFLSLKRYRVLRDEVRLKRDRIKVVTSFGTCVVDLYPPNPKDPDCVLSTEI